MTRTVFITGAGRGIGLAVARAFAGAGDKVAAGYRTEPPPDGLFGVRCDVTDPDSIHEAIEQVEGQYGRIEVVVANAGITRDSLSPMMSDADFRDVLETNVLGAFRVAKLAIPGMLKARWGRIVFMSSVMGFLGSAGQTNYAASKSALLGLTRSLAWEMGSRNITVNAVVPGLIDTEMIKPITDKRRAELLSQTALGRIGTPDEVAAVVRFLAGAEAGYVTGAAIPVGGGLAMGL
ncbi:MAG TPA: 3-oxoacyl-ACP reductase FabG [Streptosporangiaceae bacterium]|nr:3-oxoacyl-ACP reductase FabG [Streptosporangiaceae bacterium]